MQQQCNIASTLTQFFHVAYRQPVSVENIRKKNEEKQTSIFLSICKSLLQHKSTMLGRDRKKNKKYLSIVSNGGHQCQVACKVDLRLSLRAFPPSTRQRNVNATRFCL